MRAAAVFMTLLGAFLLAGGAGPSADGAVFHAEQASLLTVRTTVEGQPTSERTIETLYVLGYGLREASGRAALSLKSARMICALRPLHQVRGVTVPSWRLLRSHLELLHRRRQQTYDSEGSAGREAPSEAVHLEGMLRRDVVPAEGEVELPWLERGLERSGVSSERATALLTCALAMSLPHVFPEKATAFERACAFGVPNVGSLRWRMRFEPARDGYAVTLVDAAAVVEDSPAGRLVNVEMAASIDGFLKVDRGLLERASVRVWISLRLRTNTTPSVVTDYDQRASIVVRRENDG